jgi:hypothetical protein
MNSEINMLEQQLQDEQESSDNKSNRITKIEKDMRDLRVQLEQKIEMGKYRGVMVFNTTFNNISVILCIAYENTLQRNMDFHS